MADETTILSVAEAERDQARQALERHQRTHGDGWRCHDCRSLAAHVRRTEEQVALLTPADAGSEALW